MRRQNLSSLLQASGGLCRPAPGLYMYLQYWFRSLQVSAGLPQVSTDLLQVSAGLVKASAGLLHVSVGLSRNATETCKDQN